MRSHRQEADSSLHTPDFASGQEPGTEQPPGVVSATHVAQDPHCHVISGLGWPWAYTDTPRAQRCPRTPSWPFLASTRVGSGPHSPAELTTARPLNSWTDWALSSWDLWVRGVGRTCVLTAHRGHGWGMEFGAGGSIASPVRREC
jgi:hypothetical protein